MNKRSIAAYMLSILIGFGLCGCAVPQMNKNGKISDGFAAKLKKDESDKVSSGVSMENTSPDVIYKTLAVDEDKDKYTYEDMQSDLKLLERAYSNLVRLEVIGGTVDGRNIYDLVIGGAEAEKSVVIHGSIHAREYITSKLIMKQAADCLWNLHNGSGEYRGIAFSELFSNIAVHIIPMVNPDGVAISQLGLDGVNKQEIRENIINIAAAEGKQADQAYLTQWKANAEGVDLNRNFDAMWDEFNGEPFPASDRYKGVAPGCTAETASLIQLTENENVIRTLSYHTAGEVIYWYFGQSGTLYNQTMEFANEISSATGYRMDADYERLDPAGYKDWAISVLGIPSLTVEVGYGANPIPDSQFGKIWNENKDVLSAVLYNAKCSQQ